ncbi:probable disease resistance protein At1g61300 [Cryptomeria japonica]|uniref:probable disease resistance protein At1g61300 n=1 Tax=Cryptomeria japonica TaxID=3369 RepID=UPI0027DA5686|nr:probable disease resistance protein At1g61300 [Cryptomeria japonica]
MASPSVSTNDSQLQIEVSNAFEEIAPQFVSTFAPLQKERWGIFINHRGPDVKDTLARAIYYALQARGFRVFLDSEGLQLGDFFPAEVEEAMRSASLHLAIFSPTYAQSPWCLAELSFMLKSGKPIIPVFYCVRPTDLRWVAQGKGVYVNAFSEYEEKHRFSSEKLQEWKTALHKVSFYIGAIINNKDEEQTILESIGNRASEVMKIVPLPLATSNKKYIEEALIVGQGSVSYRLVELIHSQQHTKLSRFGIVGKGGAGKTLLLKQIFNSNQVQSLFCNDLMIWISVSQNPSFNALRNDLVKQISLKVNERLDGREEDHVKSWLNETMAKHKFALFLDDLWERSANSLLEELCVPLFPHHKSNIIIATSRTTSVLSQLGVPNSSLIQMQDLTEDDSWSLFSFHAFPHSEGILPSSINEEIARGVSKECGGLPLALKVIGHAMAGITYPNEWEFALQRLQNKAAHSLSGTLSSSLRLSYDALADVASNGISLQLCFLYIAAFSKAEVISTEIAILYWIGEGLVVGTNPLQIGEMYVNLLADRCLIEPVRKDNDGRVIVFTVHDVLYDLAHQIAEKEEKCFFQSGRGFSEILENDFSEHVRISLMDNSLTRIPKGFRAPYIRSLLLAWNLSLTGIPKEVIRSMTSLKVLDLSKTAVQSLPKNMECLKNLVCLRLYFVPIKRLPDSIAALQNLQILDLYRSDITELPAGISKLTTLKLLDIGSCRHLQYMPSGISNLRSLEYLAAHGSSNIGWNKREKNRLSISDLGTLHNLKRLGLENNNEIIREGTLGSMKQMESLYLLLTGMERLPKDITSMSKLRKLWLLCPQLLQIENSFCVFQHLSSISIFNCRMLKQLPALHNLPSLKQLDIVKCPNIEKFPEEFGKGRGFPKLEIFSVLELEKIEQLPIVEEGALPSLKILTIMKCEALQRLPQCYWNLKSVEKIRVYGCSKALLVMAKEEIFIKTKTEGILA